MFYAEHLYFLEEIPASETRFHRKRIYSNAYIVGGNWNETKWNYRCKYSIPIPGRCPSPNGRTEWAKNWARTSFLTTTNARKAITRTKPSRKAVRGSVIGSHINQLTNWTNFCEYHWSGANWTSTEWRPEIRERNNELKWSRFWIRAFRADFFRTSYFPDN